MEGQREKDLQWMSFMRVLLIPNGNVFWYEADRLNKTHECTAGRKLTLMFHYRALIITEKALATMAPHYGKVYHVI